MLIVGIFLSNKWDSNDIMFNIGDMESLLEWFVQ